MAPYVVAFFCFIFTAFCLVPLLTTHESEVNGATKEMHLKKKRLIYLNSRLIMGKWLKEKDLNRKRVKVAQQFKIKSLHNEQYVTD